jgi:uncharacterized 2Fe-2S/4Fe-4S cluster protein (DUF4445 family)
MAVNFTLDSQSTEAPMGANLFDLAEQLEVKIPTSCRKQGKCRECLVQVTEGMEHLSGRTPEELHLQASFRLACRSQIAADAGNVSCHTLRRSRMRVETEGGSITDTSRENLVLDPAAVRTGGDHILLDGREIACSREPIHGLAVDIGTTTCVVRLLNLESGQVKAAASFENPQRFGGSDVMARIQYDSERKDRLLQRTLLAYLTHAIEDFPVDPNTIYETVITGNSTMRDLFFGFDLSTIGQEPFQSVTEIECLEGRRSTTAVEVEAGKLGVLMNPAGRVYGMPLVGGHVGADAAACMLAVGMCAEERTIAIMDVGTNTEVVVGNKDKAVAASCPAGPAFEGGAVACGMPGLEGAIERVRFEGEGRMKLGVIGGGEPEGICGSGLIDLLSELVRSKQLNVKGRFEGIDHPLVIDRKRHIVFTESDVNELALAKGANVAGLSIILKHMGLVADDIEVLYLAGAFGRHLNTEAATRIGFLPGLEASKYQQVGNAAIEGATMALLSLEARRSLEELIRKTTHLRLEADPAFFDTFVDGCLFVPFEGV